MSETTIKCTCSHCGAKYRLPVEAQGRKARCKKCGNAFEVPKAHDLEDSILAWLSEPEAEEEGLDRPRVISMKAEQMDPETAKKMKGPIRIKSDSAH